MFRPIVALLFLGMVAWGQESRGTIAGVVTDAQAAGIPKARVVITNLDTGVDFTLETNERGTYSAPLLLPGNYRIAAEHEGFKKFMREGITLSVNDNVRIDIQLDLGAVTETVNVTDSAPLIESASGNMGMLVSNKEVTELPLAHGNPYALISLAPGTTFEGDPLLNRPYEPTNIVGYSMGGADANTTDITLDGVSNTSRGGAGKIAAGYVPPADAIGEVRIETNSFDARAGQTSGGLVNISLRSGTNKIRGNGTFTKMTAAVDGEHLVRQPRRFRARRLRLQPLERIAERTHRPAEDLQRPQPDVLHVGLRAAHGPAAPRRHHSHRAHPRPVQGRLLRVAGHRQQLPDLRPGHAAPRNRQHHALPGGPLPRQHHSFESLRSGGDEGDGVFPAAAQRRAPPPITATTIPSRIRPKLPTISPTPCAWTTTSAPPTGCTCEGTATCAIRAATTISKRAPRACRSSTTP